MANQLANHKTEETVRIALSDGVIEGNLTLPETSHAVVLFAHGSGSSRFSPRNRFVADVLHDSGLATLLIDLLTPEEERVDMSTGHLRFDIDLLADRLVVATDWLGKNPATRNLRIGYFGASTGAAAALVAASKRPGVWAIVSRGGRPDLAGRALENVRAAVLLLVGGNDWPVLELNRDAYRKLNRARAREMHVVPGASHLFEERGTLEEVARLAANWFRHSLSGTAVDE